MNYDNNPMAGVDKQQDAAMNQLNQLGRLGQQNAKMPHTSKAEGLANAIDNVDSLQRNLSRLILEIQGEENDKATPEAERPFVSLQSLLNNGETTLREKVDNVHKLIETLREVLL